MRKKVLILSCLMLHGALAKETPDVFTPQTILADGVDSTVSKNPYTGEEGPARKGTVAATVNNVFLLNQALLAPTPDASHIESLTQTMRALVPSLNVIGMFNFFSVDEWLSDNRQPGRILVAILYLQHSPEKVTETIRQRLDVIRSTAAIAFLTREIDALLGCR